MFCNRKKTSCEKVVKDEAPRKRTGKARKNRRGSQIR